MILIAFCILLLANLSKPLIFAFVLIKLPSLFNSLNPVLLFQTDFSCLQENMKFRKSQIKFEPHPLSLPSLKIHV